MKHSSSRKNGPSFQPRSARSKLTKTLTGFRSRTYLESELSDIQKKKVDMLVDKVLDLNIFEVQYFQAITKEKILKTSNINPMKLNLDWPSLKPDGKH